jgi:hypothetical protein
MPTLSRVFPDTPIRRRESPKVSRVVSLLRVVADEDDVVQAKTNLKQHQSPRMALK